jgi:hypothetical protein
MYKFKMVAIILVAFSLAVHTGCISHNRYLMKEPSVFDMLPYWMPLNEGTAKSFRSTNPYQGIPLGEIKGKTLRWGNPDLAYTTTVKGTEVIKGIEAVKVVVTESNIPAGINSAGSYIAYLPDLSQGKTILKRYIGSDPVFGIFYMLNIPFETMPRYVNLVEGRPFQTTSASACFKEDTTPLDSCITITTTTFLGFEDVTVPAGTFKDCIKSRMVISLSYARTPESNFSIGLITWSAKGLGEIKSENVGLMLANERDMFPFNTIMKGEVYELISAKVAGVTYPKE